MKNDAQSQDTKPWYKHGMVWLVISGPAVVVVAAFVTLYIAVTIPDPVISSDYYRQGLEVHKTPAKDRALVPATQARNHAATPAAD